MPGREGFVHNPEEISSKNLETRILKNFYLSFKFSQGNAELQQDLLIAINTRYNHGEFIKTFISLENLKDRLTPKISKLRLPKDHLPVGSVQEEFKNQWRNQLKLLNKVFEPEERHKPSDEGLLIDLVAEDASYMETGRPNSGKKESLVKTYIINQQTTGSEDFDNLFKKLREVAMESDIAESAYEISLLGSGLSVLKYHWEQAHPGQKFIE
jgi:hypothetical protein